MAAPSAKIRRLDALVGTWRTTGQTIATESEPAMQISGTDTYEWLAGGFFLLHRVDVHMGDERVQVLEIIGDHDPASDAYTARFFDNQGNTGTMTLRVGGDGVWTLADPVQRATLKIGDDRDMMTARWERSSDGTGWLHWMDMTFRRIS